MVVVSALVGAEVSIVGLTDERLRAFIVSVAVESCVEAGLTSAVSMTMVAGMLLTLCIESCVEDCTEIAETDFRDTARA